MVAVVKPHSVGEHNIAVSAVLPSQTLVERCACGVSWGSWGAHLQVQPLDSPQQ